MRHRSFISSYIHTENIFLS